MQFTLQGAWHQPSVILTLFLPIQNLDLTAMNLVITNMVCPCCFNYVKHSLGRIGIDNAEVTASGVTFPTPPSALQLKSLEASLHEVGLEIVQERKNTIVEQAKILLQALYNDPSQPVLLVNLSIYLTKKLGYNYSYLSNLFSEEEGMTIRDYCMGLRIDQAKHMLVVEQLDLLDISIRLNFSSPAHLATQFKKVTGLTSMQYKAQQTAFRPIQIMVA
jgi:AraC-like DNA-binding protein